MYMTWGDSVQRPLTGGPKGWPASQVPRPTGQLMSRIGPKLLGHMSTREGEGYGGGQSWWRLNSLVGRPRGSAGWLPLGELPHEPSQ
jgi:hypothetical protein